MPLYTKQIVFVDTFFYRSNPLQDISNLRDKENLLYTRLVFIQVLYLLINKKKVISQIFMDMNYLLGCPESSPFFKEISNAAHLNFDIHLFNYIIAILFYNLSPYIMQLKYSIFPKPFRFFDEKLFNMIFYFNQS